MSSETINTTLILAILGGFPILGGVIKVLYDQVIARLEKQAAKCEEDRKECEDSRDKLWMAFYAVKNEAQPHVAARIEALAPDKFKVGTE